ncbi:DUF1772 domain-containing protein [Nocardia halotolerans]|uniref:DUF1772 domain-containing protein n=1 Tax=Nocardia halotolerans TaxID=1755878 RepID=A0ABV8VE33_9NOCA
MTKHWLSLGVPAVYAWIATVAFSAIAVETIIIYPNVFHDVPASLTQTSAFFEVSGPADFFRPLGAATIVAALASTVLVWRVRAARWWVLASLLTLVFGEFLFSVLYFWPRNQIMFDEGAAVHSTEALRRAATEFETAHWGRLAMSAITALAACVGFLRLYRDPAVR